MSIAAGIFKAYDIRGLYPEELSADVAARIGYALTRQLGAASLAVGMDPRPSSPELAAAFSGGAAAAAAQPAGHGPVRHDAPLPAAQRDDDPRRGRISAPAAGAGAAGACRSESSPESSNTFRTMSDALITKSRP